MEIVKVPTTRTFSINLNNVQYNFASGYGKTEYDNGLYTLLNQDSYFISSDGVKTKVNNNYVPSVSGVLIKDDSDYVSLFYYGVVSPNNVSQFSTVFTPSGRGADFAKETMRVIINGKEVTKITFSEALPYYDEHGLKLQLNKGQSLLNGVDVYEVPYSSLPSTNLKYSATNVSLEYRLSETRIFNNPRADTLQMILNVSGVLFERFETFEYAYSNYNSLYGFEIVQSYALADRNVKDSDIQYWLNQKSNFAEGYMKSTYGTFLNALSVFWLSDKYASSLSDYYDVDWSRDGFFIILSGVESGYKSYINSLDPTLGRLIQGADNNTHAFSFMNSLILSEIENVILKGCGHSVDSPISFILNAFLSGESLDLIPVNESSAVILKLSDNDNFYIMIDLENFIVHGVFSNGSQIYKGAYSISDSGCYHDYLSDELVSFLSSFVGNFLDAFMDPYILLGTFGGLAITAGFVAAGPFGWGVALGLIAGGLILNAASSHLFDNFGKVNAGYTDLENWLDFGVGAFISVLGAKPAYTAGKSAYKAAKLTISSEMKDYSSKTKITSRRLSYSPKSIEENLKRYTFENRVSDVYRCTLGETKTDIVLKILKEHSNGSFVSAFLDEVKV